MVLALAVVVGAIVLGAVEVVLVGWLVDVRADRREQARQRARMGALSGAIGIAQPLKPGSVVRYASGGFAGTHVNMWQAWSGSVHHRYVSAEPDMDFPAHVADRSAPWTR